MVEEATPFPRLEQTPLVTSMYLLISFHYSAKTEWSSIPKKTRDAARRVPATAKKFWSLPPSALRLTPSAKRSLAGPSKLFLPASRPAPSRVFLSVVRPDFRGQLKREAGEKTKKIPRRFGKGFVIPEKRLELLRSRPQQILSLSCLPFHHSGMV